VWVTALPGLFTPMPPARTIASPASAGPRAGRDEKSSQDGVAMERIRTKDPRENAVCGRLLTGGRPNYEQATPLSVYPVGGLLVPLNVAWKPKFAVPLVAIGAFQPTSFTDT
jgi:hypothetical protein